MHQARDFDIIPEEMLPRLGGSILVLAGAYGWAKGIGSRGDAELGKYWWAISAAGAFVFVGGFALASVGRGPSSRASFAFICHMVLTLSTAGAFYQWRDREDVRSILLAAVVGQLVAGLILLPCVIEAKRRVGPIFLTMLAAFVALLGASVYAAVKVF